MRRRNFIRNSVIVGIGSSQLLSNHSSKLFARSMNINGISGEHEPFKGCFPIMQTPYLENEEIDADAMAAQVSFVMEAGGSGMVWPQLASEFYVLTNEERMETAELMVSEAGGRIPMIVGVQSTNFWKASLKLAKHAESIGADGIISLPPYTSNASVKRAGDYYQELAQTVKIPIFIQNSGGKFGPAMPTDDIIALSKQYPNIAYVKEESDPVTHRIGAMVDQGEGILKGVFSGGWGSSLLNELRRGCVGTMPGSSIVDVYEHVISLFNAGKMEEAQSVFDKAMAMVMFKRPFSIIMEKEILRRRGVFKNTIMRTKPYKLEWDEVDQQEFEVLFNNLKPYFKV